MTINTPVTEISGVGKAISFFLSRLGIKTVLDLLYHFPISYEDFSNVSLIANAQNGITVTLRGKILELTSRKSWHKRGLSVTEAIFQDKSGAIPIVWFGRYVAVNVPKNVDIYLMGSVQDYQGKRQMVNPLWEVVATNQVYAKRLVPIYSLTLKLTQWVVRKIVKNALANVQQIEDFYPESFRVQQKIISRDEAIRLIHNPKNIAELSQARKRLAFDELFLMQLSRLYSFEQRKKFKAPVIKISNSKIKEIISQLPFSLTKEQGIVLDEIFVDLNKNYPMQRLLQGEVGSGKSAIAFVTTLTVVSVGYQVIYLAPTEVLARQQYDSIFKLFKKIDGIQIALLTSSSAILNLKDSSKQAIFKNVQNGKISILIGTHVILNDKIKIKKLGLVVVDEQHRFGVDQRFRAQKKSNGQVPHLLSMTATPIPRTMQLAFYGDLDVSTLKTIPYGERQVKTVIVRAEQRQQMEERLRLRIQRGEQAYIVCPLINPSDILEVRAVSDEYKRLQHKVFPEFKLGFLHGKMKIEEKHKVLNDFKIGGLNILVSTSVIEVGIDVANANIMIIEGAERFGLAQLHQLRGRVGRRGKEGFCLLFIESSSVNSLARLRVFTKINNGFELAEQDLKLRGPGEWFGVRQSGFTEFKIADLNDVNLINETKLAAISILRTDPELKSYDKLPEIINNITQKAVRAS